MKKRRDTLFSQQKKFYLQKIFTKNIDVCSAIFFEAHTIHIHMRIYAIHVSKQAQDIFLLAKKGKVGWATKNEPSFSPSCCKLLLTSG